MIVSCDGADLHPTAIGIEVFADQARHLEPLPPPRVPRSEVIDELVDTVLLGKPPVHSGAWARATTETCLAILESTRTSAKCLLQHQVPAP